MLEQLSPRQFESWCQLLFERTYHCRVRDAPHSGDEGRDLLIDHPDGLIVVECKHQPSSSVGRPVVQKLHSAILTAGANKGIIATTGFFARTVHEYAKRLDVSIDLLDGNKLAFLAEKAGIPTSPGGQIVDSTALAIPTLPEPDFIQRFGAAVLAKPHFSPGRLPRPAFRITRRTEYAGYFLGSFTAAGELRTAVGPAQETWSGSVWIRADGTNAGTGLPPGLDPGNHIFAPLGRALSAAPGSAQAPGIDLVQAYRFIKEYLVGRLARKITYTGRNNQTYTRLVRPSPGDTNVRDVRLVYVPSQAFTLEGGGARHQGWVRERPPGFLVSSRSLTACTICKRAVRRKAQIICAACFQPAHRRSFMHPDSFRCTQCAAQVCHRDARKGPRGVACTECAGPKAKGARPRWVPHLVLALVIVALSLGTSAAFYLAAYSLSYVTAPVIVGLFGWAPLIFVARAGNGTGTEEWESVIPTPDSTVAISSGQPSTSRPTQAPPRG